MRHDHLPIQVVPLEPAAIDLQSVGRPVPVEQFLKGPRVMLLQSHRSQLHVGRVQQVLGMLLVPLSISLRCLGFPGFIDELPVDIRQIAMMHEQARSEQDAARRRQGRQRSPGRSAFAPALRVRNRPDTREWIGS